MDRVLNVLVHSIGILFSLICLFLFAPEAWRYPGNAALGALVILIGLFLLLYFLHSLIAFLRSLR